MKQRIKRVKLLIYIVLWLTQWKSITDKVHIWSKSLIWTTHHLRAGTVFIGVQQNVSLFNLSFETCDSWWDRVRSILKFSSGHHLGLRSDGVPLIRNIWSFRKFLYNFNFYLVAAPLFMSIIFRRAVYGFTLQFVFYSYLQNFN